MWVGMEKNQGTARVGEILLAAGAIDETQLSGALAEQCQWGGRLGVTLVKLGMVTENDLIRALAQQLGLPVASVAGKRIPEEVIALVPARVAFERGVLPLFLKTGNHPTKLFLGMEDPSDFAVLDDLSFRTGLEIQPVMVGPSELSVAIDKFYLTSGSRRTSEKTSTDEMLGELNLRRVDGSGPTDDDEITENSAEPILAPVVREVIEKSPLEIVEVDRSEDLAVEAEIPEGDPLPPLMPTEPPAAPPLNAPDLGLASGSADSSAQARIQALEEQVRRAEADAEKTRAVVKAMTQILVERGLLPFGELQKRTAKIKNDENPG